jgi:hypothetical protein
MSNPTSSIRLHDDLVGEGRRKYEAQNPMGFAMDKI